MRTQHIRRLAGPLAALLLSSCTGPDPKINEAIGSPCGFGGGLATVGTGVGVGLAAGAAVGAVGSLACGPFYPLCLAVYATGGAFVGLVEGTADAISDTPACPTEPATAVAEPAPCADEGACRGR